MHFITFAAIIFFYFYNIMALTYRLNFHITYCFRDNGYRTFYMYLLNNRIDGLTALSPMHSYNI